MEYIGESSENEMISLFLQTEVKSARYSDTIFRIMSDFEVHESIVLDPDISSDEENIMRKNILSRFRGYGEDREIFDGFPKDVHWTWVYLTTSDLEKVKYINYSYWIELSGGSRSVKDAVCNIRNGVEIFGVKNDGFLAGARYISEGNSFPPMILVSDHENIIVLEGHFRLTVYMLEPDFIPDRLKVMMGYTVKEELNKWCLY